MVLFCSFLWLSNIPLWGFPGGSVVENLPAKAGDMGLIPGFWRCPGEGDGNPLQYSCLENPRDRGAWWAAVCGVAQSWIWLNRLSMPACIGVENGNPFQYSCLENPRDGGAWWAAVYGVAQSWTWLKRLSMHACIGVGNGNPLQYSCMENPRDRGAWWAAVYGVAQSRTWLKRLSSSSSSSSMSWLLQIVLLWT